MKLGARSPGWDPEMENPNPGELGEILDACAAAFKRRGIEVLTGGELGCGIFGCAFEATVGGNPNHVVKVTQDESEVELANWLHQQSGLPRMLPRIRGVFDLSGCSDVELYAVVREDLEDADPSDLARGGSDNRDHRRSRSDAYDWLMRALEEIGNGNWRTAQDRSGRALEAVAFLDDSGAAAIRANVEALGELREWMQENDVLIADLHRRNIGWRPSEKLLVVRDLGQAKSPMGDKPPILSGLSFGGRRSSRRRGGGMRLVARREPWR